MYMYRNGESHGFWGLQVRETPLKDSMNHNGSVISGLGDACVETQTATEPGVHFPGLEAPSWNDVWLHVWLLDPKIL